MTESGDEAPGIDSIKADVSTPSNAVERLATHEAEAYGQRKSKATPTELHHAALNHHLAELSKQCARFETQVAERDEEIRALRRDSAWLTPEHARLTESYNNLVYNNAVSYFLVTVGGVTVSVATATPHPVPLSCVGMSVFGAGIIAQALQLIRGKWFTGPKPAPRSESDPGR